MTTESTKKIIIKEHYELKTKLKEDHTGIIYDGWDSQAKKAVQIKRYRPELLTLPLVEKLQEAVYRLSVVNHLAFPAVLDCTLEKKNFFVIQEPLVEEETIGEILSKLKSFTVDSALSAIKQTAQALSYLHQKKICHGNLDLENICIMKDGSIKIKNTLLDAIIQHARLKKDQILGSPAALAPEQLRGEPTKPQSDIWALSILFYRLLTGETPFKESKNKNQLLQNIAASPIRPTLRNPKIPKYIEDLILKSIQNDPKLRPRSMLEFLSQLESKKVTIKLKDLGSKKKMEQQPLNPEQRPPQKPAAARPIPAAKPQPKPAQPKKHFWEPLLHKTKQVMHPEAKKKLKTLPKQLPKQIKNMADKFDAMMEERKTRPPLFRKPQTFFHKFLVYGTIVIAVGIIIALSQSLFIGYFTSIPEIKVPDLKGLPLEEARDDLENMGLKSRVVSELINSSVPLDHIISQNPDPGRVVKKDRVIKLFVSKGVGEAKVPELIGRAIDQATAILSRNGLGLEVTKFVYSAEIQKNYIMKQNPEPEVIVQKNTTINVTASHGFPTALNLKDKSPYNCVVEATLFVPNDWAAQKIKLNLSDSRGTRTVFDRTLQPGDKRRVQLISEDTALVEIFYNDELALKQSFLELGDLSPEKKEEERSN
ncbi:PASTA domain-containing protein [Candidatus Margulisiibacteriota bacterium]